MKIKRLLLAAAIAMAGAACSGDVTAPDPALHAAEAAAALQESTTPTLVEPIQEPTEGKDSGYIGSGVGR